MLAGLQFCFLKAHISYFHRNTLPALVTGSEDGVLRVHKVLVNEASKQISGIEMVSTGLFI